MPATLAAAVLETEVLYVASTPEDEPFERLAVDGLAFRGAAHLEVYDAGVLLRIAGEPASFVPVAGSMLSKVASDAAGTKAPSR